MDAPKQEPLTLAHCPALLPNPDSPSCSTLTLSSSHPRLTACLFACLLACLHDARPSSPRLSIRFTIAGNGFYAYMTAAEFEELA